MLVKKRSVGALPVAKATQSDRPVPLAIKCGRKSKPVVEFPTPLTSEWVEPASFGLALALHAHRHGDSYHHLHKAIVRPDETFDRKTLQVWAAGQKIPQSAISFEMLERIEHRYRLPKGYFREKLPTSGKAVTGFDLPEIQPSERRRLAWHLPVDFDRRPSGEQAKILEWVRTVIISGSTDYRRFQSEASKQRYALRVLSDQLAPRRGIASAAQCAATNLSPRARSNALIRRPRSSALW